MSAEELRILLDSRPHGPSAAEYLNSRSPRCECEGARACHNGHGPVRGDECLSYFLSHPRQTEYRLRDPKALAAAVFPYKAALFDAAFSGGLSVMREEAATDREIIIQVEKIVDGLKQAGDSDAGIHSVLHFPAATVHGLLSSLGDREYCIYDTPIDVGDEMREVLSHADVFGTAVGGDLRAIRSSLRVRLHNAVSKTHKLVSGPEYRGGLLGDRISTVDPFAGSRRDDQTGPKRPPGNV